jgi:hypothetical protein
VEHGTWRELGCCRGPTQRDEDATTTSRTHIIHWSEPEFGVLQANQKWFWTYTVNLLIGLTDERRTPLPVDMFGRYRSKNNSISCGRSSYGLQALAASMRARRDCGRISPEPRSAASATWPGARPTIQASDGNASRFWSPNVGGRGTAFALRHSWDSSKPSNLKEGNHGEVKRTLSPANCVIRRDSCRANGF